MWCTPLLELEEHAYRSRIAVLQVPFVPNHEHPPLGQIKGFAPMCRVYQVRPFKDCVPIASVEETILLH